MGRWGHIDPRGQTDRQMVAHRETDGDTCTDIWGKRHSWRHMDREMGTVGQAHGDIWIDQRGYMDKNMGIQGQQETHGKTDGDT